MSAALPVRLSLFGSPAITNGDESSALSFERRTQRLAFLTLVNAIRACLERGDEHAAAGHFIGYWSGSGAWDSLSAGRQQAIAARMRAVLPHFSAVFRESVPGPDAGRLPMPLLFLTGEHTVDSTRRIGALLRDAFPHAEHDVLDGMAHMGPMTHAAQVNRRIEDFLVLHAREDSTLKELCEEG